MGPAPVSQQVRQLWLPQPCLLIRWGGCLSQPLTHVPGHAWLQWPGDLAAGGAAVAFLGTRGGGTLGHGLMLPSAAVAWLLIPWGSGLATGWAHPGAVPWHPQPGQLPPGLARKNAKVLLWEQGPQSTPRHLGLPGWGSCSRAGLKWTVGGCGLLLAAFGEGLGIPVIFGIGLSTAVHCLD